MKKVLFVLVTSFILVLGCKSDTDTIEIEYDMVHVCRSDSSMVCQKDSVCTKDSTVCVKDTTK